MVIHGRPNPVLMDYLHRYEASHDITYIIGKNHLSDKKDSRNPFVTNKGEFAGYTETREEYFALLRKSRVAFYATSGADDERPGCNGFHQVTPRFLEAIASGCNVLARYIDNSDTRFFELDKMAHRVTTYEDFKMALEQAIEEPPDTAVYAEYLKKHCTSVIAHQLEAALKADG